MAKPDLSAGMMAKSAVYEHVANDFDTGKPIMKRKTDAKPAENPEAKKEGQPVASPLSPASPSTPIKGEEQDNSTVENNLPSTPVVESKPQNTLHKPVGPAAKGTAVRLPDGTTGKLAFSDGVNARVRTDDGRSVNAKHKDITPMNEVKVKAHTRMVPARNDQ